MHESRLSSSLKQERLKFHLKRRGSSPQPKPDADTGPFALVLGAAAGFFLWGRYGKQLRDVDWQQTPVIKQFYALVTGDGSLGGQTTGARPKQRAVPTNKTLRSAPPLLTTKVTSLTTCCLHHFPPSSLTDSVL